MKQAVLSILSSRLGQENAVTAREIADKLGVRDTRQIRRAIRELRMGGIPIASSPTGNAGYFIPTDRDEAEHCLAVLWHQVDEIIQIARPLGQAFKLVFPARPEQLSLFEEAA